MELKLSERDHAYLANMHQGQGIYDFVDSYYKLFFSFFTSLISMLSLMAGQALY